MTLGTLAIHREVADLLASQGIASLRLASRGVGRSEGEWLQSSFEERRRDVLAAVATLRAEPGLRETRLGLVGTSEGAALAVAAASEAGAAFVVALSLPMTDGLTALRWQRDRMVGLSPLPEAQKRAFVEQSEQFLTAVQREDEEALRRLLEQPSGALLLPDYAMVPRDLDGRVRFAMSPWYRSQVTMDVRVAVRSLSVPLLGVYGGSDRVLDAVSEAGRLREAVGAPADARGRGASRVQLVADRDHLLLASADAGARAIDSELWLSIARWIEEL
jgi:alpha-beta hydrolase superfamily lysophospholipase